MSNTIKAAIQALKGRLADAYTAISNKGGTLPATQDSANLPSAIASIPSGGNGLYYSMSQFGLTDVQIEKLNGFTDNDLAESLPYIGDNTNVVPFTVCTLSNTESTFGKSRTMQGNNNVIVLYITGGYFPTGYVNFYQTRALQYIVFADGFTGTMNINTSFYNCSSLRAVIGAFKISAFSTNGFYDCPNLRHVEFEFTGSSSFNISGAPRLNLSSLIYILDHLHNVTNSPTCTLGTSNVNRLNATAEGQAALAAAQAKGWTIA